jgi:tryptophan synthase alpha chain
MNMSRIQTLFTTKSRDVLNVYVTAGYPELGSTLPLMKAMEAAGADLIELGMPYSDPLADGPVIQASSAVAIENGMTLETLFTQLRGLRPQVGVPVILMGYMNPVMQYGFERFCADASAAGVDGLILPDLPEFEFEQVYGPVIKKYQLDFIFLVTPETSEERVRRLDALSSGFLYAVSSSSTTGKSQNLDAASAYLQRLQSYGLRNPILVGFGISDRDSFRKACDHASGAIIGSAFIRAIGTSPEPEQAAGQFIREVLS